MERDVESRLDALERRHRRTVRLLGALCTVLVAGCVVLALRAVEVPAPGPERLRLSELVIVDPSGVERVRLSGRMPDAVIDGRRIDRGSAAAGVMLYDRTGQERGGYVTWDTGDNVGLTLDGQRGQQALFVAGPDGATALQLWHGAQALDLRADANGARLSHTVDGHLHLQLPRIASLSPGTCTLFRNGLRPEVPDGLPPSRVRDICTRRVDASACDACLVDATTP